MIKYKIEINLYVIFLVAILTILGLNNLGWNTYQYWLILVLIILMLISRDINLFRMCKK